MRYVIDPAAPPTVVVERMNAELARHWYAVRCTPPGHKPYVWARPCESLEHAISVQAGLPERWIPARVETRTGDGQWVPAGPERGCAA